MTNELSALNDLPGYSFTPNANKGKYYEYRRNTLGYLQQKIKEESNGKFDSIKPICINGKPQYVFIDSSESSNLFTMPLSHLYQPVIVSSDRARQINQEAEIAINIECSYAPNTQGIDIYQSLVPEEKELYSSKIPLSNIAFNYPIKSVEIELVEKTIAGPKVITSIPLSEGEYNVELGSLYVKEAIDNLFFSSSSAFDVLLTEGIINPSSTIYYRLKIKFDLVVEDSGSSEHSRMALTQATSYAIMDLFNQHTYASVTANMIGEIAYTETLTLISTLISTPLIILGSWSTMGTEKFMAQMGVEGVKSTLLKGVLIAGKIAISTAVGAVKEVFEEIIKDGFIETWAERQVQLWGGNEQMGFWFSSLCTSGRESISGSGKTIFKMMRGSSDQKATITTALSNSDNLNAWVSQNAGKDYMSDAKSRKAIMEQIELLKAQGETDILLQTQKKDFQLKIIGSGLATAFKFALTGMFLGSQTMTAIISLSGFSSTFKGVSAKLYGRHKTDLYNSKVSDYFARKDSEKEIAEYFVNQKSDIDQEAYGNAWAEWAREQMPSTDTNMKAPGFVKEGRPSEIEKKLGISLLASALSLRAGPKIYLSPELDYSGERGRQISNTKDKQISLAKITKSQAIKQSQTGTISTTVEISLEGLSLIEQANFNHKIEGFIKTWENDFAGKGLTFRLPKDSNNLEITEALQVIQSSFSIDKKKTLRFWAPSYGVLYEGLKIPDPIDKHKTITITVNTKLSDIETLSGLTVIFDVPSLKLFKGLTYYKSFRDDHSYKLGGDAVVDMLASDLASAQVFNVLGALQNRLANKILREIKLKDNTGFRYDSLLAQSKKYHDSLYHNDEVKNTLLTGTKTENEKRWENWLVTSDLKYEVSILSTLLGSKTNFEDILVRIAEELIFDLITRDYLKLDKRNTADLDGLMEIFRGFLENKNSIRELTELVLGPKAFSLFWKKLSESYFDDSTGHSLRLRKDPWRYHGRIGEEKVYSGNKRIELLEAFIDNNYQPLIIMDGINFGIGPPESGNKYLQTFKKTITEVKERIFGVKLSKISSALYYNRRFYDGDLAVSDKAYYGGPTKYTIDPQGIGLFQIKEISSDSESISINTLFFEVARGVTQLKNLKELIFTINAPPVSGDVAKTLSSIINEWSRKHHFGDFGKGTGLKMPSDSTYASYIIDELNIVLRKELSGLNEKEAAKKIVLDYISDSKKMSALKEIFKSKAIDSINHKRFNKAWFEYDLFTASLGFIQDNIDSLLIKNSLDSGYKVSLNEHFDLLFLDPSGKKVTYSDLPSAFTVVNGKKVTFTKTLFDKFKKEKKPLLVVHDINGEFGVIPAEMFNDLKILESLDIFSGYKHTKDGKYKNQVFQNVFICDSEYTKLYGKVKIEKDGISIEHDGWVLSHTKIDKNNPIKTFYAPFTLLSGNQLFSSLQKITLKINPLEPHQKLLPAVKRSSLSFTKISPRPEARDIDLLSDNVKERVDVINNLLIQLDKMYSKTHTNLLISDEMLQINGEYYLLKDGTKTYYSLSHLEGVFSTLAPDSEDLKKITLFLVNPATGNVEINNIGSKSFKKEFYRTYLTLIQNKLTDPLFEKYSFLSGKTLSPNTKDLVVDATYNDRQVINLLKIALDETFGLMGLTLLKMGLMTVSDSFKMYFRKHTQSQHGKFLSAFNIRPLDYYRTRDMASLARSINVDDRISKTYIDVKDIKEVFASLILSGHDEIFSIVIDGESGLERFVTSSNLDTLSELFENVPDIFVDSARFHSFITSEYMQNLFYKDYSITAGTKHMTNLKNILLDILDKNLESFDIDDSIFESLSLERSKEIEINLLKQQIKLALLQHLFTFEARDKSTSTNFRLRLRDYLEARGTLTVELNFFIDSLFDGKVKSIVEPYCKLKLTSLLFEKFAKQATEMGSFLSYTAKVWAMNKYAQNQAGWLVHDKVLNSRKTDIIKISSFLKHMAKTYGPLRIYGFRMTKNGLTATLDAETPNPYFPSNIEGLDFDNEFKPSGAKDHTKPFILEYDDATGGFKNFDMEDFRIFIGALLLDRQTMVVRTEQMTNDPLSKNKVLFTFNFWQNRLKAGEIVGGTGHTVRPVGPDEILAFADGLFGIPTTASEDLLNKWELFMKEKQINLLYRFVKYNDWELFLDEVYCLNVDLASLGTPKTFG